MSSPLLRGTLGSLPLARGSWGQGHALGRSTAFPRGCVGRAAPSPRAGRDAELRGAADQGRRTGPALWGGCESGPHPRTRLGTPTSWAAPGRRTGAPGGRWAWGGEPAVSLRTSAHPGAAPRSQGQPGHRTSPRPPDARVNGPDRAPGSGRARHCVCGVSPGGLSWADDSSLHVRGGS